MLSPYPLQEVDNFFYRFTTDTGISYHIYFLDYSYMFTDYPEFSGNIYSFNIDASSGNSGNVGPDERIGLTVVEVFKTFFRRIENVAVYVCDNTVKENSTYGFGNTMMVQLLKKMVWQ